MVRFDVQIAAITISVKAFIYAEPLGLVRLFCGVKRLWDSWLNDLWCFLLIFLLHLLVFIVLHLSWEFKLYIDGRSRNILTKENSSE